MTQKYAHLMNGFSITVTLVLMNGFSKTDSPLGRGPPNRWGRIGFSVCSPELRKNPKKLLDFLHLKK